MTPKIASNSRPMLETWNPDNSFPRRNPIGAHRSHFTAPPLMVGIYPGDYTNTKSHATDVLDIEVISQTSADHIYGTAIIFDNFYKFSGSINSKGRFSFHGSANHQTVRASGTASPDGSTLVGKFSFSQRHGSFKATFSAGRAM